MATWKFRGLDKYVAQLEKLSNHAEGQMKAAVWEGAKVVADNMKAAINALPVQDEYVKKGVRRSGITSEEKEGLIAGFGLSKMRTGSAVTTKAGFQGKNAKGISNAGVARQITSGTSWLIKSPGIRNAVSRSKSQAEAAMQAKLESEIRKMTL